MKTQFLIIPMLASLLLVGCSGVRQIGQVGNVTYYRINVRGFSGPNITTLVSENENGVVHIETAAAGGGIGHTIISSAGGVGASAAFGLSLRPDRETVNNGSDSNSGSLSASTSTSNSSATGGNSSAAGGNSNATGGNGNGGAGGSGGAGGAGGSHTHPASPGNGGIPGNGGANKP